MVEEMMSSDLKSLLDRGEDSTLESIKVVQFARNQLLASYLSGMGYMEKRGEGILRMIAWSRQNQAPEPKFELPAEELFQVTLFKRNSNEVV